MPSPDRPIRPADLWWTAGLVIGLPLLAAMLLGVDSNWDLRNYHLYNPHAWLSGRHAIDIAPAQVQTWHNPLLDLPLYLIVESGVSLRWASAWLALPCMIALFVLLRLHALLSTATPSRPAKFVLAFLGLTGAATYSTLGLSMNDAFVAAAILGSLALVLGAQVRGDERPRPWLLAGLLAGAIAGLKLTAVVYCIGLVFAAFAAGPWRQSFRRLLALAVGGLTGVLCTYGYWGWWMFRAHGNPVFPYYNNVFGSPDALAESWTDTRLRPDSIVDALAAPFELLWRSRSFSELLLKDPRLLIGITGLLALCWLHYRRSSQQARPLATLLVFFVTAFLAWVLQYAIYRYAIVLELLGCLALVLVLQELPRARNVALLLALLLVSADTKRPNWGRLHSSSPRYGISQLQLPVGSLVIIATREPLAYMALALPDPVPLVSVANALLTPQRCGRLQARVAALIAGHAGPIWLLAADAADQRRSQLLVGTHYGLESKGSCKPLPNDLEGALLCPQHREGTVPIPAAGACTTTATQGMISQPPGG